jgi:hypothetical protein
VEYTKQYKMITEKTQEVQAVLISDEVTQEYIEWTLKIFQIYSPFATDDFLNIVPYLYTELSLVIKNAKKQWKKFQEELWIFTKKESRKSIKIV